MYILLQWNGMRDDDDDVMVVLKFFLFLCVDAWDFTEVIGGKWKGSVGFLGLSWFSCFQV